MRMMLAGVLSWHSSQRASGRRRKSYTFLGRLGVEAAVVMLLPLSLVRNARHPIHRTEQAPPSNAFVETRKQETGNRNKPSRAVSDQLT